MMENFDPYRVVHMFYLCNGEKGCKNEPGCVFHDSNAKNPCQYTEDIFYAKHKSRFRKEILSGKFPDWNIFEKVGNSNESVAYYEKIDQNA